MHAIVHGADIQDRDGGAVLMATLFGAPFHSCLSSTRTAATKGRSFRRRRSAQWRRSTLKSSSGPTAPEGSSFYQSAGLLRGLSRGSIAVADWRKTGSVSAERPSHSYGSPQSGSCCESYAFKRDVRGQTLRHAPAAYAAISRIIDPRGREKAPAPRTSGLKGKDGPKTDPSPRDDHVGSLRKERHDPDNDPVPCPR